MADIPSWRPENVERLIAALQAENAALKAERDKYRDAWRAVLVELAKVEKGE